MSANIQVGVDGTDHIAFFCPQCRSVMEVDSVMTKVTESKCKDKCTWIKLHCEDCGFQGQRKFYWTCEDGEFIDYKTPNIPEPEPEMVFSPEYSDRNAFGKWFKRS